MPCPTTCFCSATCARRWGSPVPRQDATGECGTCTVLVDGAPVLSCLTLSATVAGRSVETVESLAEGGRLAFIQEGFHRKLGSQCGYCTPGLVMASEALLRQDPDPSEDAIREALGSNICRCTGYVKIIEAVRWAAESSAAHSGSPAESAR